MPQVILSLGDGRLVRSNETGDVFISTVRVNQLCGMVILRNAVYVPEIVRNLLSGLDFKDRGGRPTVGQRHRRAKAEFVRKQGWGKGRV